MVSWFKNFIKSRFYILKVRSRFNASTQIALRSIYHQYREMARKNEVPPLRETGFRVFSQFEEDGLLLFIFAMIGTASERFIEIGANDGINSNCANLAINFGWHGLFVDADKQAIKRGIRFYKKYPDPYQYPPKFIYAPVTRENINGILKDAGFEGSIDLLSIDIDGNDYWIWDAISVVEPRVVIIETHVEFGLNNVVVPYDPNYVYPGKHPDYHGASPVAMIKLGKKKGYRFVGANRLGHNHIFVKEELAGDLLPEVDAESVLQHPSTLESFRKFEPIRDWKYVRP